MNTDRKIQCQCLGLYRVKDVEPQAVVWHGTSLSFNQGLPMIAKGNEGQVGNIGSRLASIEVRQSQSFFYYCVSGDKCRSLLMNFLTWPVVHWKKKRRIGRETSKLISQVTNQRSDSINFSVYCGFGISLSVLELCQLFLNPF